VLLLGEIDLDKDDDPPPGYEKAEADVVHNLNKERKVKEARVEKVRLEKLKELGFEGENNGEALICVVGRKHGEWIEKAKIAGGGELLLCRIL